MRTHLKQTDFTGSFINHSPFDLPAQKLWEPRANHHPHSSIKSKEIKCTRHGGSLIDSANNNVLKITFCK